MSSASLKKIQGFIAVGTEAPFLDPDGLVIVGLDEPETDENWYAHCQRLRDESDADLADYITSIRSAGTVDNPIQGCRDGHRIVVLDGRRTTRAARIIRAEQAKAGVAVAERVKIRVVIHAGEPDSWYRINVGSHKAKPLTPMQRARGFLHLWKRFGEDHARVAALQECSVQTVKNQLKVFDLSTKAQHALDDGKPLRELIKLADLPREKQDAAIAQLEATGATGGAAASNGISAAKRGEAVTKDETRTRSRLFLEKLVKTFKKVDLVHRRLDAIEMLKFVLGGPPPKGLDEQVLEALEAAGFKHKVAKK